MLMESIKGIVRNGVIYPIQPISYPDNYPVIITFLESEKQEQLVDISSEEYEAGWDTLELALNQNAVDTGIRDLAHQHDHYLYGKQKQDE
ncbi:conserved hypothetical protein [Planktothrix serta PCC 8927]|uniref:DUF104 domain-containing protein n=2 Tax=Planktothrix TaxID=54304 RepID=A0A7Z9E2S2_9CYAN|nr:conserved hypothetical protein [Planktothrix serta PCC 8927]